MQTSRLATMALVGAIFALGGVQTAQAQVYGGFGYGYGHHGGYYSTAVGPYGGYPYGGWAGSHYRAVTPVYAGQYSYGSAASYGIGIPGGGATYGLGGGYAPLVVDPPVYGTTTTIIRGGPRGGVMQYSTNGNGYSYVPDSTYPTVIQQSPTLGLSRTIVQPSPPPVVIESRPQPGSSYDVPRSPTFDANRGGTIKLSCPKSAPGGLSYSLNGNFYTIQPGYSQTIKNDRAWTLEFKRGGDGSETVRFPLNAGTYTFAMGADGWDIQQGGQVAPAADIPPAPIPDLSADPTPALPPTPLPPP